MSNTETTTRQPTAWFLAVDSQNPSGYSSAARWFWPKGVDVEVWQPHLGDWTRNQGRLFETLHEDPGWVQVEQDDVDAWIAAVSAEA